LVERVTAGREGHLLDRYLLLLCAIQVAKRIRKDPGRCEEPFQVTPDMISSNLTVPAFVAIILLA
jgi:hypothetical protein